eukprot:TRINITY_DN1342_c0_g1_i3.p1 TRINITY_DN1342_c0_g1~~TRINITY_DN1342_c0_g1_i3.p1  ORF type:complete len:1045 (-),score=276.74 TRINITY_DN1342_c0_g1_i3:29-3163(-)
MGVPGFFSWLKRRWPRHVVKVKIGEDIPERVDGVSYDNLYLDMNGMVHPAAHGESREIKSEEDMKTYLFSDLDQVIQLIRPQNLLMLALDGVAPRAKMNQQRARRFLSAMRKEEKKKLDASKGKPVNDDDDALHFDSNTITPGTPFMHKLQGWLTDYIKDRLETDPLWKNLKVVFSGSNVPGEGEHKILDFIRKQRASEGFNADTEHVFYGLDADLIFLSLATHEANFTILRDFSSRRYEKRTEEIHPPSPVLFLRNVPKTITVDKLTEAFGGFGALKDCRLALDANGSPKSFAFVEFEDVASSQSIVDQKVKITIDDVLISVSYSRTQTQPPVGTAPRRSVAPSPNVFVGNLPYTCSEDDVAHFFKNVGKVLQVRIITSQGTSKGFGYVTFATVAGAQNAVLLSGRVKMDGRILKLDFPRPRRGGDSNRDQMVAKLLEATKTTSNNFVYDILETSDWDYEQALAAASEKIAGSPTTVSSYKAVQFPLPEPKTVDVAPPTTAPVQVAESRGRKKSSPTLSPDSASSPPKGKGKGKRKSSRSRSKSKGKGKGKEVHHQDEPKKAVEDDELSSDDVEERDGLRILAAGIEGDQVREGYMFLQVRGLREYIQYEIVEHPHLYDWPDKLAPEDASRTNLGASLPSSLKTERVIDDFIFLAMFVGNDFLPVIPGVEVHSAGMDLVLKAYKRHILSFFHQTSEEEAKDVSVDYLLTNGVVNWKAVLHLLKFMAVNEGRGRKSATLPDDEELPEQDEDFVKDKREYYSTKLPEAYALDSKLQSVSAAYLHGMQWVMSYYFKGVPSWSWFYPHHYAPYPRELYSALKGLLEDCEETDELFSFGPSAPLNPFQQLVAVLPPSSHEALPVPYQSLMTSPTSPLSSFYPTEFEIDRDPKAPEWHAVVLLDFINVELLQQETEKLTPKLTPEEVKRNSVHPTLLLISKENEGVSDVVEAVSKADGVLSASVGLFGTVSEQSSDGTISWVYVQPNAIKFGPIEHTKKPRLITSAQLLSSLPFLKSARRHRRRRSKSPSPKAESADGDDATTTTSESD